MKVTSIRHRGLRRFIEHDDSRSLPPDLVNRTRRILTVLKETADMGEFRAKSPPGWRIHPLSGDRPCKWSVRVSGNWRITFEERDAEISRLDLEDYH